MPSSRENRLAAETSPYLLQHRHDPVDWYPWGPEAFAKARELDRPVFLSIGYSACHWCHVMAHESFSDEATAEEMNRSVVSVKVDREERPDVDAVYMEAVQAATGRGGWPMSVFATPDGQPFFAGTYFPNRAGAGAPSFRAVLAAVADAWENRREAVVTEAASLSEAVAGRLARPEATGPSADGSAELAGLDAAAVAAALEAACERLADMADPIDGGFGRAPKFPQPLFLELLLHAHAEGVAGGAPAGRRPLEVALQALEAMASGGIWDHLGGGFARYSVDRHWLVPHFEKMLYDEALLARTYLHAWQVTGDARWRQVLEEIIGYVERDLSLPGGGVASAEDADSEGEEGRFYTWTLEEIEAVLGPELTPAATEWWGVRPGGNFEGRSILFRPVRGDLLRPQPVEASRRRLFEVRAGRPRPARDGKLLTEWNAMFCATLAEAALATSRTDWRQESEDLGRLLLERCRRSDGRVLRCPTPQGGREELLGYSGDVAWLVEACVRLAECTGDSAWLESASELAHQLLALFEDQDSGGLFTTGHDAERLLVRPRELYDGVIPSATSVAAAALARLSALTGSTEQEAAARRLVDSARVLVSRAATAVPGLVIAADLLVTGVVQVAVTGDRPDLVHRAAEEYLPRVVLAWDAGADTEGTADSEVKRSPLLSDRPPGYAYVCRSGACRLPAPTAEAMDEELRAALSR